MKKLMPGLLFLALIVCACSPQAYQKPSILTTDNLVDQVYSIDPAVDTTIITKGGSFLFFPAGSLSSVENKPVGIKIKEALTINDIVLAGLLTASGNKPLSSGGMINIQPTGPDTRILKAIKVAIPSDNANPGMEIYKGEADSNGNIDWTEPEPLGTPIQTDTLDTGQALFEQHCASCHMIGAEGTGPDLAHFVRRFPDFNGKDRGYYSHYVDALHRAAPAPIEDSVGVQNEPEHISHPQWQDRLKLLIYRCNLQKQFGNTGPSYLPGTADTIKKSVDFKAVLNYVQKVSDARDLPMPSQTPMPSSVDSCITYLTKRVELENSKSQLDKTRETLIAANGPQVIVVPDTTWLQNVNVQPTSNINYVSPPNFQSQYYQFSIESFGWYNVDMMLANVPHAKDSKLTASVTGNITSEVNLFLVIPSVKTYAQGGPAVEAGKFAFYDKSGTIPLPHSVRGFIIALQEAGGKMAYGITAFTTAPSQHIEVSLRHATPAQFTEAVNDLQLDRLYIRAGDAVNANEIRAADKAIEKNNQQKKELEKWRPVSVDCDCGFGGE